MIRGDDHRAAALPHSVVHLAETAVDRLHAANGWLDLARVPDHVSVGEIYDHHVERRIVYRLCDGVRDALCGHLGRKVVGRDFL